MILNENIAELALIEARKRNDCDCEPEVVSVDSNSYPGFVHVEVRYSSRGYQALYEYRQKDGTLYLAQD